MIWMIRWYPRADTAKHLVRLTSSGEPDWGDHSEARVFYDHDGESAPRAVLRACRKFHGEDEDIVLVKVTRVRRKRSLNTCEPEEK